LSHSVSLGKEAAAALIREQWTHLAAKPGSLDRRQYLSSTSAITDERRIALLTKPYCRNNGARSGDVMIAGKRGTWDPSEFSSAELLCRVTATIADQGLLPHG
jgi:hypothetical protein